MGGAGLPGERGDEGGEEGWEVHDPGCLHGQDARETRDQGGQAGDLRQGGDGEGKAGQDHCESVRSGGTEEGGLSPAIESGRISRLCHFATAAVARGGPAEEALGVFGAACAWGARAAELYMGDDLRRRGKVAKQK